MQQPTLCPSNQFTADFLMAAVETATVAEQKRQADNGTPITKEAVRYWVMDTWLDLMVPAGVA